ncbi:MAG: hypothetical protein EOP04_31485 [Proteobacteria bacterium]|nr:MAG: hypothetical protein EOP04_31485 [Pseudomonadota bacterium]
MAERIKSNVAKSGANSDDSKGDTKKPVVNKPDTEENGDDADVKPDTPTTDEGMTTPKPDTMTPPVVPPKPETMIPPTTTTTDPVVDEKEAVLKACMVPIEVNIDNTAGGQKFKANVADAKLAMQQAGAYICGMLYKKVSEIPPVKKITLNVRAMDGVAYATGGNNGKEIHFSSTYINGLGGDVKREIDGVLVHENVHIWQNSGNGSEGYMIEGVADWVRAAGAWYAPGSRNSKGGAYKNAYTDTGFFIGHLNATKADFGYKLNAQLKKGASVNWFQTETGKSIDTLWSEYQSTGTFSPKVPSWQAMTPPVVLGKN